MTFCDAAGTAFVVAAKGVNTDRFPAEPFKVVIGVQSWIAELDRLGPTPEANRPRWRASLSPELIDRPLGLDVCEPCLAAVAAACSILLLSNSISPALENSVP